MSCLSKFIKIATVLSASVLITPLPALAGWVKMGVASDRTVIYINSDAVVHEGQHAAFIAADSYAIPRENGAKSSLIHQVMDCKSGISETKRIIDYDARQRVVADYRYADGEAIGAIPAPRSPAAAIQKYVCSR